MVKGGLLRLTPFMVLIVLLFYNTAHAAPVVNGQYMRDYARITFEWPQQTHFSYRNEGRRLTLEFDHPATGDFSAALHTLTPFLQKMETAEGGKSVIITLDKPYKVRTFVSDKLTGVDILGIDMSRRGQAASSPTADSDAAANTTEPTDNTAPSPKTDDITSTAAAKSSLPTPVEKPVLAEKNGNRAESRNRQTGGDSKKG